MTPHDPSYYTRKIRRLSQALLISGAINIGTLAIFSYWIVRERPPTPYFELKPASSDQQQSPLVDLRGSSEMIYQLQQLSFSQLLARLNHSQLIENGYTERDLALSTLVDFHNFDILRALPNEPKEKRLIKWKHPLNGEWKSLTVYPGLTEQQFETLISFARTERWPLNFKGLFLILQKQKQEQNIDSSLVDAFVLAPEFLTAELLFSRTEAVVRKQKLLEMVLEGAWEYLRQFVEQQKQLNDLSVARRQKFLLDYIQQKSETAAYLLIELDPEFAVKKLDDAQVIFILQLLPNKTKESEAFALQLLTSPRSTSVWQQASLRLYEYTGETIPEDWSYQTSLQRFVPDKALPVQKISVREEVIAVPNLIVPHKEIVPISKPLEISEPKVKILNPKVAESIEKKPKILATKASPKALTSNNVIVKPDKNNVVKKTSPSMRLYIVQEGDSLWKISKRFSVDMEVLKKHNQLKSNAIKPGTVLKIP